jgi:RND superfamily putative drug exporter
MRIFPPLGVFVYRYRWMLLVLWGVLLAASVSFAPDLSERLKGGGFGGSNSEAQRVQDLTREKFGVSTKTLTVVFDGDGLPARSEPFQKAEKHVLTKVRELDEVGDVASYSETKDPHFISKDREKSCAVISLNASTDKTRDAVDKVRSKVRSEELKTYVTGAPAVYQDLQMASNEDIERAERYALPFVLLILVFAFGTVVAAGLPILTGGASMLVTLATLYFVAGNYDMSIFVLTLSTMLGLGLGIDYALFFVSRFREELENHPTREAVPRTVAVAGRSIFFSGTAVLIGFSGLLFFPFMSMRSIGIAGMIVAFISVLAALTLLPAALAVLGHQINALPVRRRGRSLSAGFWGRSAEVVMRHPVIVIFIVAAILSTLLYPVSHMKVGVPEASVLPQKYESRAGDDVLKREFDYAALNPMEIVATLPEDPLSAQGFADVKVLGDRITDAGGVSHVQSIYTVGEETARKYAARVTEARKRAEAKAERSVDETVKGQLDALRVRYGWVPPGTEGRIRTEAQRRAAQELERKLPKLPHGISANGEVTPEGVASFLKLSQARDAQELQSTLDSYVAGKRTLLQAVTEANPYSEDARATMEEVRAVEAPEGVSFLVGGLSAWQKDFISSLYRRAPLAAAFVLGVTYLILLITFRSVFIPLKAVIVNVLSLTASFGAMVFVFQDGNLSGILGFIPLGFVDATLPILMFCTIFGVSMDYEVFLLSRIREAYENGDSNTASVAKGLVATAGIITSAAAIIIVVTGAFAFTGIVLTKAVGLGLAVAVFVDATIIRVLLVPATMCVLGDWNWWPGGRKSAFGAGSKE